MKNMLLRIFLLFAAIALACCCKDRPQTAGPGFATSLREADSVYNHMEFNKAYDLYLKMLDLPETKQDDVKLMETLYSLANVSEMASQRNDQMTYLAQLIDLARSSGNDYYLSQALMLMGKHVYYEGDHSQGIALIREAADIMSRTDRRDTDHMTHSQLNVLSSVLAEMHDIDAAIETDKRNVDLTFEGTRWGTYPQIQLRDQRTALAKLAAHQVLAGLTEDADSAYLRWKAVPLEAGANPRDYFIVDYLRGRGRYAEAAGIYGELLSRLRSQTDTMGAMMKSAKLGLADVNRKMGKYCDAADLYAEVLEISDTLTSRQARRNAQELSALYKAQEKEHRIRVREMWITGLCWSIAVLIVILVAIVLGERGIRKKNRFMAQALDELASRQPLFEASYGISGSPSPAPDPDKTEDASAELFARLDHRLESERLYLNPELNRDDLCRLVGINKNMLGGIIRRYGNAVNSQVYINRKRIRHAVVLMREHPNWTMFSIAEACGMTNTATFNRTFRQTYGITPSQYLKSRNGANPPSHSSPYETLHDENSDD